MFFIFLFCNNKYIICGIICITKIKRLTILERQCLKYMELKELVHQLISISVIHRFLITKSASSAGLYYGQPNMLQYIKAHDGCTQKELAKALFISPPSAATSLKRMERSELITRTSDSDDPRKNHISVTPKGLEALDKFTQICKSTDEKMFEGFSKEDIDQLYSLLSRLHKNLDIEGLSKQELHELLCSKKGDTNET